MFDLVTIGVYGFSEASFFQALAEAGVDTFCDIRQRRGVRGSLYAFANSQRLQQRLSEMGIRYVHLKELAPTAAVRQRQYDADMASKRGKRKRQLLSPTFVNAYQEEILDQYEPRSLLDHIPADAKVVAFFCVEREPAACHRSLAAKRLSTSLGLTVAHILPE